MLPLGLALVLMAVCAGCSLQSVDALNRCDEAPSSPGCALPGGGQGGTSAAAGAGGTAGTAGAGGAGVTCAGDAECAENEVCDDGVCGPGLVVRYAPNELGEDDVPSAVSEITPRLRIENRLAEDVAYSELSIRYYYTMELTDAQTFKCYLFDGKTSGDDCGVELEVTFADYGPVEAADQVFELGFVTDAIIARTDVSNEIKVAILKEDFSSYDQTDDYSFDDRTELDPWTRITLHRDGALVWGTPPE